MKLDGELKLETATNWANYWSQVSTDQGMR